MSRRNYIDEVESGNRITTTDPFFATCLIFSPHAELLSIDCRGRHPIFTLVCDAADFKVLQTDYLQGKMMIVDAQALGKLFSELRLIIRDTRGGVYTNPDFEHLRREQSRTK